VTDGADVRVPDHPVSWMGERVNPSACDVREAPPAS
jgi:hypothetical protein